jgi:CRP/FNR family transcriptional regulator, cyclic AMP receptor protein
MSAFRSSQPRQAQLVRLVPEVASSCPSHSASHQLSSRWHEPSAPADDSLLASVQHFDEAQLENLEPVADLLLACLREFDPDQLARPEPSAEPSLHPGEVDPLYLVACRTEWELRGEPSSAWELVSAANSVHEDTRAHARCLLANSQRIEAHSRKEVRIDDRFQHTLTPEASMKTPYGLEIIESCVGCKLSNKHFFCGFSPAVLRSFDVASHHSILPAGALLFVEGQTPRGIYIICSGKVKLSTTSKEGKVLILKQAEAGEVLGLSATTAGMSYEMTAETATPCQLNFINRTSLMNLLQCESEVGVHAAQWLSRDFQAAYRDIHNLVLARSSAGKLAKLLLSCAPAEERRTDARPSEECRLRSTMTHEEMAQRIGSSRETVTRLLSDLKKKRLIRLEGATLVIRDRSALEALAV